MATVKYQLTIQYDGNNFHGWQVQAQERTVQGDIEKALKKIYSQDKIVLIGSGRTDSGVHALAQVAHVELPDHLSGEKLCRALNGNLREDVWIESAKKVENNFHARFSAKSRYYEYHLVKNYSPIYRNYAAKLLWNFDLTLLNQCAENILGENDFTSFCKSTAEVENKVCKIYTAKWEDMGERVIFFIEANRFLHHMVRYLVGTMLEVSRERYSLDDFINLIHCNFTNAIVVKAPACGLFLTKVNYE